MCDWMWKGFDCHLVAALQCLSMQSVALYLESRVHGMRLLVLSSSSYRFASSLAALDTLRLCF